MKKLIVAVGVIALAAGGWLLYRENQGGQAPVVHETAVVERGQVREVLETTGIIKSQVGAEVKIGARVTGLITDMLVRVGDRVEEGDLITVIDDRELASDLREAEARISRVQAELERVRKVYPLQIEEARAQLDAARATAAYAATTLERQEDLLAKKLVPQDAVDDALERLEVARGARAARQATLERLQTEFTKERTKAEKALEEARASREALEIRLSYTRIHAPISGVVSQVAAQEGETVVSGLQVSNLITIVDSSRLEMWVYVDETDIGRVSPGLPVEFQVDAYAGETFRSQVEQVYPRPEIRDNIVYYLALVPITAQQARRLRPEMTSQCAIVVATKDGVLALPNQALKWVRGQRYVFVQDEAAPGGVRRAEPELGLAGLQMTEVLSGLAEGDRVATSITLPDL